MAKRVDPARRNSDPRSPSNRLDLNDELARRAREHGVVFAINTDSHAVPHLDYLRYGIAVAQRGWVAPDEVINTWPVSGLRQFLAKGRC